MEKMELLAFHKGWNEIHVLFKSIKISLNPLH